MVISVVCICHNQGRYLREAVESVLAQTWQSIDLWILDDASSDNSAELITQLKAEHPSVNSYISPQNIGHNRLFNKFLPDYKGNALIDLAADDVLCPERVRRGVEAFAANPGCGVNFTNAFLIDAGGKRLDTHYAVDTSGRSTVPVPEGQVFAQLLSTYYINPVSMMIRREVMEALDGYDESLSYEDFDFWIRSSREFSYCYTDELLVKKRLHASNYSFSQYTFGSRQMRDTWHVCRKARDMIRSKAELKAFHKRLGYEMRQCLRQGNLRLFYDYSQLL